MKDIGIYIHIPFCKKKCDYCDFVSYCEQEKYIKEYIDTLEKEIKENLEIDYNVKTIYIGGGTPSSIDSDYIKRIMKLIKIKMNTEVTIEVNPGTVTEEKLEEYKKIGINRLSIGLQETHDDLLKQIGRIHNYEEFLNTYKLARKLNFNNINIDLMIGLPNQSIQEIKESLEEILKLNSEHISVYSLILEEGTVLYKKYKDKKIELPDEETERNMYWYVKNKLEENGYIHYEISNFSKPEYKSRHNLDCWEQKEYIGFGVAAHSYINKKRFSNTENIKEYIEGKYKEKNIHEVQNFENMKKEYMLLGLRKINGVSIQNFKNKFGENPIFLFREELNKLVCEKLIYIDGDNIKLTNKGIDLANIVWEEFI